MKEFRLEDLWAIIQGLIIVGVGLFALYALWALAPQIGALARAFWARHFSYNWWDDFLIWLADQGSGVNDYEDEPEAPRAPPRAAVHMSSQAHTAPPPVVAVPGTATKPVPSPVLDQNDLTYDDAVRRAAAIKINGKWLLSGKKLYSHVGGNHDHFLRLVSEVRGDLPAHDIPASPAVSPIAHRPLPAGVHFHSDPDLQYSPPD